MKSWLPVMMVLAAAGCGTARTAGASDGAPLWFAENASSTVAVDAPEGDPDQPTVRVEATSATAVRYRTEGETLVRLPLRPRRPINRRQGAIEGMLGGAAIGALAGVLGGAASDRLSRDPSRPCEESCGAGPIGGGLTGMIVGGIVGATIGHHRDRTSF
jgi:hypothetical protein